MSCNCEKPQRTSLWTPIPEYRQPTAMLPGENIECYMQRAGNPSGMQDDVAQKIPDKIENTVLTSDINGSVNDQFKLSPESSKTATSWNATIDGAPFNIPGLTFNSATGQISGTVTDSAANKTYKVLVKALDETSTVIDSKEYTFTPKKGTKEDTIKFVFPYTPNGRVTSGFGPRVHPVTGGEKAHQGIDISQPGSERGSILAAADGTVVRCGPANGYGNVIDIEHRDAAGVLIACTRYAHMNKWFVSIGQKVAAGQIIAEEGNAGVGTAAHLHFELHKGGFKNPVDPIPYLNGEFMVASNNAPGQAGVPSGSFENRNNNASGMTRAEVKPKMADANGNDSSTPPGCPKVLPNQAAPTSTGNPEPPSVSAPPTAPTNPNRTDCARTESTIDVAGVRADMRRAMDEDPDLDEDDKKFIDFVAKIESGYDPYAKNPTSSATGLYQMLDSTASAFFKQVGIEPSCQNRCDAYASTKAMIRFYKSQLKPFWNGYQSSGQTKIAGKQIIPTAHSARYPSLTRGEFMYGLIHHDGVGNAVKGIDYQGIDYWRKKIRSA